MNKCQEWIADTAPKCDFIDINFIYIKDVSVNKKIKKAVIANPACRVWQSYLFMNKQGYIYIITNKNNSVIYTGVTSNLKQRIYKHKQGEIPGFSQKYKVNKLVYYEIADDMYNAITREKQIKKGSRKKKISLIESMNLYWDDLYNKI